MMKKLIQLLITRKIQHRIIIDKINVISEKKKIIKILNVKMKTKNKK